MHSAVACPIDGTETEIGIDGIAVASGVREGTENDDEKVGGTTIASATGGVEGQTTVESTSARPPLVAVVRRESPAATRGGKVIRVAETPVTSGNVNGTTAVGGKGIDRKIVGTTVEESGAIGPRDMIARGVDLARPSHALAPLETTGVDDHSPTHPFRQRPGHPLHRLR